MSTTVIRNADWVIAWDVDRKGHCYRRNADVAFQSDRIIHVGGSFDGRFDTEIDGSHLFVMPGLINSHAHPALESMNKGFSEDDTSESFFNSGLYDRMNAYTPKDAAGLRVAAEKGYAEMLKSGVTTVVDLEPPFDGWFEVAKNCGLRVFFAPMFRSAEWHTDNGNEVVYRWRDDGGEGPYRQAMEIIDQAISDSCGRLGGIVTPSQVDTCTPELLRKA